MKQYRLTDEELASIMEASKPVPYLVIGGVPPQSPHEKAMRAWAIAAQRVGCVVSTIADAGTGDSHDFIAEPMEAL